MFGRMAQHTEKELSSRSLDYNATILDEIALEGLDGITLQGLWVRLGACPYFPITIDPASQKFIWEIVKRLEHVHYFELPSERAPLVLYNRFEMVDQEMGDIIEPEVVPDDIYPFKKIDDQINEIVGSCASYEDRCEITDIARQLSLEEVTRRWGSRLVLVASQSVRSAALMGDDVDPCLELSATHFCILERIGRARYHGEVTQGKVSLHCTGEDPKTLFYYRKILLQHRLITKQCFNLKTKAQNCSGSLLHLPRFFLEHKSKIFYLTEKVVDMLKSKLNCIALYEEIRNEIGGTAANKKLFKTPDFQRFVRSEQVPYRMVYPDATVKEWKHKSSDREKVVRIVRLVNPFVSVKDEWAKEDEIEEEEEGIGYVDESTRMIDVPLMTQAFNAVDASGDHGLSQVELSKKLGMTKLQARTLCRNLERRNLVSTFKHDAGRQRSFLYCSKRFDKLGRHSQELHKERDKMLSLLSTNCDDSNRNNQGDDSEISQKKKRVEENGTPADENMDNSDGPMPVLVECIKSELPDFPFMESTLVEGMAGGAENPSSTETENPEHTSSQCLSRKRKGSTSLKPPQPNKKKPPTEAHRKESRTTELSHQHPVDEIGASDSTEIVIAEDASFINTKATNSSFTDDVINIFREKRHMESPKVTTRVLKRVNLIIAAVKQQTVIDDVTKLLKLIHEEEEKEGLKTKIDRKSLLRLLEKLNKDGYIKNIQVHMKGVTREKNLNFVCEPHVTVDHSMIQSAIDQAKLKLSIPTQDRLNQMMQESQENAERAFNEENAKFNSVSINESISEMSILEGAYKPPLPPKGSVNFKHKTKLGKQYGYQPKFVRMKTLHRLLFYLVHDYLGVVDLNQVTVKETLNDITPLTPEIEREMPQVYFPAVDWRMFIPPIPSHPGWPKGWAIMCDILLRIPLSIFLHLVNINYEVEGLNNYLSHPVRKHYLVRHLPLAIIQQLTAARRYIFNCHEVATRLCYIGLLQFGPQKLKEKDQVFIYLNKNASLMDTKTSSAGYHQISLDKEYKVIRFHFNNIHDVERYWYELWSICVNTPLGIRASVSGTEITVEVLENKPAMEESLYPRNPDDAAFLDNGEVPGDHSGAAGLDSALFAHVKRNWNWFNNVCESNIDSVLPPVVNDHLPQVKKAKKRTATFALQQSSKQLTGETLSPESFVSRRVINKNASTPLAKHKKRRSTRTDKVRKVPLPRAPRRKPHFDSVDLEARNHMNKRRVNWTASEDNLLLICKVAATYLSPHLRYQAVKIQACRDLLHRYLDVSKNKTAHAIRRRIHYMMKNPSTARSVSVSLEEIKQDPKIDRQFGNLFNNVRAAGATPEDVERIMNEKFAELVAILQGRFQNMRSHAVTYQKLLIPDTLQELRSNYYISSPGESMPQKGKFQNVCEVADIHAAVVNSIIYSSLCCQNDKTSFTYQLFRIYQQYPDGLIRTTMAKIRSDQMVSLRRAYAKTKLKSGQFLPVSNCPNQLSISYIHLLQTRYQYEIFHESFVTLQKLAWDMLLNTDVNGLEFLVVDGGSAATFIEYLIMDKVSFQITIPDQLIILDPRISDKDETYNRMVDRYRDILRKCNVDRDLASATAVSSSQNPFMEILTRDDVWNKDGEADSESEFSSKKKRKISEEANAARTSEATSSKLEKRDLEREISDSEDEDDVVSEQASQTTPQHAVARAATRIALYMMREEKEPAYVSSVNKETQHAHDFFVVNSCKVVCRLKEDISQDAPTEALVGIDPRGTRVKCAVSRSLLPVNAALANEVLDDIKKNAIFEGPTIPEELILLDLVGRDFSSILLQELLMFVLSKNEFGATMKELRDKFSSFLPVLTKTLKALLEAQILLRAGVTEAVVVHYKKVRPWLVHSRKLLRLDREKLPPTDGKAVSLVPDEDSQVEVCNMEIDGIGEEVAEEACDDEEEEEEEEDETEDVDDPLQGSDLTSNETEKSNPSRKVLHLRSSRVKRGVARLQEGPPEILDEIDSVPSDLIRVCMRPWIRIDGSINRRVLDRLLGAILGHIMSNPGCSLEKVGERFSPALQPFHSRELCEILQKLGCVQCKVLQQSHKVSLFSKPRTITLGDGDGTECERDICLDPSSDCVIRLGLFIGDKAYKKDFLSGLQN